MLEQEITLLREEIALLREALQAFTQTLNQPKAETPKAETPKAETPKAEAPKAETPKAKTPKVETPKVETPKGPVMDDLQELCMQIVRADRSKKDAVKNTIAKYGAETLVGVAAADYPALFADLKAL
jgi:hypothetical protein